MKDLLIAIGSYLSVVLLFFLGLSWTMDVYPFTYTPKHKAQEYFEYWYEGNEFKKPELSKIGEISKVGKENYLIVFYYCKSLIMGTEQIEVENARFFDKRYKIVSEEQLKIDISLNCEVTK